MTKVLLRATVFIVGFGLSIYNLDYTKNVQLDGCTQQKCIANRLIVRVKCFIAISVYNLIRCHNHDICNTEVAPTASYRC